MSSFHLSLTLCLLRLLSFSYSPILSLSCTRIQPFCLSHTFLSSFLPFLSLLILSPRFACDPDSPIGDQKTTTVIRSNLMMTGTTSNNLEKKECTLGNT